MATEGIDGADGAIDLERKRGINPWIVLGAILVVAGIVFGVRRSRRTPPPEGIDPGLQPS